jgi:transcriptional regulator with XRE-family HTH domain
LQRDECGRTSIGFDILVKIAAGLGVSLGELIAEYERQLRRSWPGGLFTRTPRAQTFQ